MSSESPGSAGPQFGGASTYGAGSPSFRSGRNATAGGTKRARVASHSESATITNAPAINATITDEWRCATPATTATAMINADSAVRRNSTPGSSARGRS